LTKKKHFVDLKMDKVLFKINDKEIAFKRKSSHEGETENACFLKLRFGQLSRIHSELGEPGKDVTYFVNFSFLVFKQKS